MESRSDSRLASKFPGNLGLNLSPARVMHVDLNSCFAAIEQQANPRLRGRPTVVAAYPTVGGCILAASVEAKHLGIKTGMRVGPAQQICPNLKVLSPDPAKYRFVHQKMMTVFRSFCPAVFPKSIDEAVLQFEEEDLQKGSLWKIAQEIKGRIKSEVGEWLTVSVGLGPNRFLAKTAASLKKPDGLEEINHRNLFSQISRLQLIDLYGINHAYARRLNLGGIFTSLDFLRADLERLHAVFKSINADYWYRRLRGFEVDDYDAPRQSIGHSYALPRPTSDPSVLRPILYRLCEKTGRRLRANGYQAQGVGLAVILREGGSFNRGQKLNQPVYSSGDIFDRAYGLLRTFMSQGFPASPITVLAVTVFRLSGSGVQQLDFLGDEIEKSRLTQALDEINNKFGEFTIFPGELLGLDQEIMDRVAFGGLRDLGYNA